MRISHAFLLAAPLALSACVQLFPDPPPAPRIYPLEAEATSAPSSVNPSSAVVSVARPTGPQLLMDSGIIWRRDGVLAYMEGATWPGSTPDLLQGLLADALSRDGRVAAGVRAGDGLRGDLEIRWDLLAFEIVEEPGRLDARFAANVRVIRPRGRDMLASEIVEVSEPLADRSGGAAARALARAANQGASRIVDLAAEAAAQPEVQPSAESISR